MTVHSLWINWTTVYLVEQHHLTQSDANRYFAWIPPIFASLGGLTGGWWARRLIRRGETAVRGRVRSCLTAAPFPLVIAAIPLLSTAPLAVVGISASFFAVMMILINLHVIPLDLFGAQRAGFTTSLLTSSYGLMQMILSPSIGFVVDRAGFSVVCVLVSVVSLTGVFLIYSLKEESR